MDHNTPESSPDRVGAVSEQQQIKSILHLIDALSAGGITVSGVWGDKGYSIPGFGDYITAISVSRLTKQGEIQEPSFPLAILRIYRRNEDGRIQTDYEISRNEGKLRIGRYERITTPEEEESNQEENLRFKEKAGSMTNVQALEALNNITKRLEKRGEMRAFERKIGESYVDSTEAAQVQNILTKLAAKQGLQASE